MATLSLLDLLAPPSGDELLESSAELEAVYAELMAEVASRGVRKLAASNGSPGVPALALWSRPRRRCPRWRRRG